MPPHTMVLEQNALTISNNYLEQNPLADVRLGSLASPDGSTEQVAVHVCRGREGVPQLFNDAYRVRAIQGGLDHPNIVPCYGVWQDPETGHPCLVFPHYPNGRVQDGIELRSPEDRLRWVAQCAAGIAHMHDVGVVHGDIRPHNIFISPQNNAAITNFRSAKAMNNPRFTTRDVEHHLRHMAVELLDSDRNGSSLASDVWAFGMSALEILSGSPFNTGAPDTAVAFAVVQGDRPPRECFTNINDRIWEQLERCWSEDPDQRPPMSELRDFFTAEASS